MQLLLKCHYSLLGWEIHVDLRRWQQREIRIKTEVFATLHIKIFRSTIMNLLRGLDDRDIIKLK